ncbi:hypothetical protein GCM10007989_14620 [Devosia pacifica]|uniref:Uncharacterized protein n=1 Tax=Devosia pacifica TaxID=1335967 RepID=A0A918VT36_9HYPH|nr:hypothetical protein [Devosia pacifica]GHA20589.1 hypothetical protein GCM10007989_14620 [Devosia pacifica]
MSRNALYIVVGVLVVVVVILGIYLYQEHNQPGLEVRVDEQGVSIDGNS